MAGGILKGLIQGDKEFSYLEGIPPDANMRCQYDQKYTECEFEKDEIMEIITGHVMLEKARMRGLKSTDGMSSIYTHV